MKNITNKAVSGSGVISSGKLSNAQLSQRKNTATPRGVGVMCDFYAERAMNAELWDVEGNRYIDFAAGIAVLNTGHRHPKLMAAIRTQMEHFTHTAYQIVPYAGFEAQWNGNVR